MSESDFTKAFKIIVEARIAVEKLELEKQYLKPILEELKQIELWTIPQQEKRFNDTYAQEKKEWNEVYDEKI